MSAPAAEIDIDATMVRSLLREQHPHLATLSIESFASGWDNAMFRLGDDLCVRLPRRAASVALLETEQQWLPSLAQRLPLPIPTPLAMGLPSSIYPWRWSVLPWLAGEAADKSKVNVNQGAVLATFLRALHVPAPGNAPRNPYRGVSLQSRQTAVEERLTRLEKTISADYERIRKIWREALAAPIDVSDTWLHGDLHAQNVLLRDGQISAIIDWGDLCQGDCATDLAAVWMWLPNGESRIAAIAAYPSATPATWQRARGWAVFFGSILLDTGLQGNPRHAAMGAVTLRNLAADP